MTCLIVNDALTMTNSIKHWHTAPVDEDTETLCRNVRSFLFEYSFLVKNYPVKKSISLWELSSLD